MGKAKCGWLVGALLAASTPVSAATVCVNPAGGLCQTTIQAGVNAAGPGDLVKVAAGTYFETITVPGGNQPPEIVSTGYQLAPLSPVAQVGMILGQVVAADAGTPQYVKRRVRVRTQNTKAFNHAMLARDSIQLNGNNIHTDSFDSLYPDKSDFSVYGTFGVYTPSKAGDHGDIATNSSLEDSLDEANEEVRAKEVELTKAQADLEAWEIEHQRKRTRAEAEREKTHNALEKARAQADQTLADKRAEVENAARRVKDAEVDFEQLERSIKGPLFTLPEATRVIPGHGGETTIGEEREENPFMGRAARVR